ncbi:MAG: flagellar motor protein MotA [bacterium]|nr:flagellar motor protein MotA [bacterium]MDE0240478.1 flagellar motor protein MotA [bacterium]MDE0417816.1 flagellar motor protein MotA [bacterium]
MTRPNRYIIRMAVFLLVVLVITAFLSVTLMVAFQANPLLNGLILGVLLFGILYIFRQPQMLYREVAWIDSFRRPQLRLQTTPRLLAPMAAMLGKRRSSGAQFSLSPTSTRSILDSIGARLDESREISRYLIGLLIFLGLLGTFWGLIKTIGGVSATLNTLNLDPGQDIVGLFENLKEGMASPLSGMGTAFSSSLFGLAGSLILGFLDLQSGQALNRFYNELEEWLSSVTRLHSGRGDGDTPEGGDAPAYVSALLEQTAESLDRLNAVLDRNFVNHRQIDEKISTLADRLLSMVDRIGAEQRQLGTLIESLADLKVVIQHLIETQKSTAFDEASRTHLRNLDDAINRLVEETASGRSAIADDVRAEIRLLARTIAAARPGDGGA